MPSSTSSSEPRAAWRRVWVATLVLALLGLGCVELFWRSRGQTAHTVDDLDLWCAWRERASQAGQSALVLAGSSRLRLGVSTATLRSLLPGQAVVQLAVDGGSPLPVLEDLSREEDFTGLLLVELSEYHFLPRHQATQQRNVEHCRDNWGLPEALDSAVTVWWQEQLALAQPALSIRSLLALWARTVPTDQPILLPGISYVESAPDRSAAAHFDRANVEQLRAAGVQRRRRIQEELREDGLTPDRWLRWALAVEPLVQRLQARGAVVVFLRMPTSGEWLRLDQEDFPRDQYWDRFSQHTRARTLHFQDLPGWSTVELPDLSHLGQAEAPAFTRALVSALVAQGALAACPGCGPGPDLPPTPALPPTRTTCADHQDCPPDTLCVAGTCDPVRWPAAPTCAARNSGCLTGEFPDFCYRTTRSSTASPRRPTPLAPPAEVDFLELGRPGPEDDAAVLDRLRQLWRAGRGQQPPTNPRVVLAVGDSLSDPPAYLTADSQACRLPDFPFDAGYRLVGQPGVFDVPLTARSGWTAADGLRALTQGDWWLRTRPEAATVSFGTNDLRDPVLSLDDFARHLRGITEALTSRGVIPILVTPPPGVFPEQPPGEDAIRPYVEAMQQVAAEQGVPLVDIHRRFLAFDRLQGTPEVQRALGLCADPADPATCRPTLAWRTLLSDGIHPCANQCPPGVTIRGMDVRNDAILRMYKYLEQAVMERGAGRRNEE